MKDVKKIMVMIACVVLLWGQTVKAVAIPAFPYMPPADVQLFELIFNTYGVTAPTGASDAVLRLHGYLDLYARVLGAANEQFLADIEDAFERAKTSRKLVITSTLSSQLMQGMKEALTNGIQLPTEEEPIKDYTGIYNALHEQFSAPDGLTMQYISQVATNNGAVDGEARCIVLWWPASFCQFTIIPYDKQYVYETDKFTIKNWSGNVSWGTWNIRSNYLWSPQPYSNPLTYGAGSELHDLGMVQAETIWVQAQSEEIKNRLDAISLHPLTKYTKIENGVVDTTEPIQIDLPITLPTPANVVNDLPTVQQKLDSVPISENPAQTVTQLQEQASAKYGDTGAYAVDLTTYFPFCIPFDLVRIVAALDAEPEAPHITFPLPSDIEGGEVVFTEYEFNLEWLDPVMIIVRRGELILGGIGIILMTRNLIRG